MEAMIEINDEKAGLSEYVVQMEKTGQALIMMDPMLKGAFYVGDPVAPLPDSDWPEELR